MFELRLIIFFSLLLHCSYSIKAESQCGDWEAFNNKCFKLFENNGLQTYEDAIKMCSQQSNDSSLVTITSEEEQRFLTTLIFITKDVVDNVWIGAKFTGSQYKWLNGMNLTFTNWAEGHPKNLSENCVQMHSDPDSMGKWVDEFCVRKNLVLCEKLPVWSEKYFQETVLNLLEKVSNLEKIELSHQLLISSLIQKEVKMNEYIENLESTLHETVKFFSEKLVQLEKNESILKQNDLHLQENVNSINEKIIILEKNDSSTLDKVSNLEKIELSHQLSISSLIQKEDLINETIEKLKQNESSLQETVKTLSESLEKLEKNETNVQLRVNSIKQSEENLEQAFSSLSMKVSNVEKNEITLKETLVQLKQNDSNLQDSVNNLKRSEYDLKDALSKLIIKTDNTGNYGVPIGYIYVQYPQQQIPHDIWPSMTWQDITSSYAGLFFRAIGGNSSWFGNTQEENARNTEVSLMYYDGKITDVTKKSKYLKDNEWLWPHAGSETGAICDFRFTVSSGEVRPRNTAIRIWKRIA